INVFDRIEAMGHGRETRQFARALDRGVAGENLFDQRRAGTRQTENEDRTRRLAALALVALEEGTRILRLDASYDFAVLVGIVGKVDAAQGIRPGITFERFLEFALVLERLAERKVQAESRLVRQIGAPKLLAHPLDFSRRETVRLESSESPPALTV